MDITNSNYHSMYIYIFMKGPHICDMKREATYWIGIQLHYHQFLKGLIASRRNLNRKRPAGAGAAAATTSHTTRASTSPTTHVAVGPPRAHARNPTRPIAGGAPGQPAGHGLAVHHLLRQHRPCQHPEPRRQLRRHHRRTHNQWIPPSSFFFCWCQITTTS